MRIADQITLSPMAVDLAIFVMNASRMVNSLPSMAEGPYVVTDHLYYSNQTRAFWLISVNDDDELVAEPKKVETKDFSWGDIAHGNRIIESIKVFLQNNTHVIPA